MKKINSILIANRGEIASRIVRTCRKLGIRSIAVFSEADRFAPFVTEADVAVCLGGNSPAESYLDINKILDAAHRTGADAIHPGYGFLAENAGFAQRCHESDLIFIGPRPETIASMGSKAAAKAIMRRAGVPVVPGYEGADQTLSHLIAEAAKIGYPLLLKAVAGGGGKGMRIVHSETEFSNAFVSAKIEAQNAFGDDHLILEKYCAPVRHVEFQIFGDQHGNMIHLLERECTIQRRYQKIVEESPSPALSPALRAQMGKAAVAAGRALGYENAGTVEFILTETGAFYFLEVNTRLQVEHPVTEMITGLDLVEMQINVSEGEEIALQQEDIQANGYAIECRLYAEDPEQNFMPCAGHILRWHLPQLNGLRVDAGVQQGSIASAYYDPLLAKIITWGHDRADAQRKMTAALRGLVCLGVTTNRAFLLALLYNADFQQGEYDTHFLQRWQPSVECNEAPLHEACIAATLFAWQLRENQRVSLAALPSGWRNSPSVWQFSEYIVESRCLRVEYRFFKDRFAIKCQGTQYTAGIVSLGGSTLRLEIDGLQKSMEIVAVGEDCVWVKMENIDLKLKLMPRFPASDVAIQKEGYRAPMPAQVLRVLVAAGQTVEPGTGLIVLSSMKMENTIIAHEAGTIAEIWVHEGQNIEANVELLRMQNLESQ